MKLENIEGIGPVRAAKLREAGVRSVESLLRLCCDARGRKAYAERSGFDASLLLAWVNRADLMRVKGVSTQYSDLLEAAGVDTVKELATRVPENLTATMTACNDETKLRTGKALVRRTPSIKEVEGWVAQAKTLRPLVTH